MADGKGCKCAAYDDHLLMCCCCRAAHQHIIEEKDAEIARTRLTADERAAIELAAACAEDDTTTATAETGRCVAATLRRLLERLK